ncbi:sigma 54-interacting transcriptional regulator [Truepera radiovictrix]|uniref:Magnesium protoporphyrin chelatase, putative n=1 Tax=Truepera radiovictrix (strain DSM 17093 / CIP 108686 / LMG 22925 / RQ-24) TaxID=649638 RepID=D7CRT1_TRURR|nr:sigma 54-interacting transcriptional regulator [Truepera radiovictrix]ADI15259.1 magnesium protoporphyrin chelatase, putative [Truepera radiovictrix DSM 17093]WMT56190.1 sigma 54-interacting transcriptional regulator [Truepera radiovictrix]
MKETTLGALRGTPWAAKAGRSVKQELRDNLICRLREKRPIFPGIVGYESTVVPQVVNAILSRHNFILLGLRGQAKTRILRQLTDLLDPEIPVLRDSELNDDPLAPISAEGRRIVAEQGDDAAVAWLPAEARYIEKLATPDVTVADIIGDVDPIKAAKLGTQLGDERSVHYGLLPRANRGIFAMNELPDLAGKVQVALFNIMQEGDVQIKGYPIRLPLDVMLVFSANPEDYTARGKIITPLKDRIGSEIRTHYPATVEEGMAITAQEAWTDRDQTVRVPAFVAEIAEEVAFVARDDARVDKHSGVSQRLPISLLENVLSNAERRAYTLGEAPIARVTDLYGALSAVTGKLELEYEGELKGGEAVARDIVRRAVAQVFGRRASGVATEPITTYFDEDNALKVPDTLRTEQLIDLFARVPGLLDAARQLAESRQPQDVAVAAEFVLEGLYARKQVARSEERGYSAAEPDMTQVSRRRWN